MPTNLLVYKMFFVGRHHTVMSVKRPNDPKNLGRLAQVWQAVEVAVLEESLHNMDCDIAQNHDEDSNRLPDCTKCVALAQVRSIIMKQYALEFTRAIRMGATETEAANAWHSKFWREVESTEE